MSHDYSRFLLPHPNKLERHLETVIRRRFDGLPVDVIPKFWRVDQCPAHLLPYLARQLSVDVWSDSWSDERKRAVIAASPALHRIKGTRAAVEMALLALDQDYSFIEWWEPGADNIPAYDPLPCTAALQLGYAGIQRSGVALGDTLRQIRMAKRLALHISITVVSRHRHATAPAPVVASHAWGPNPTPRETADGGRPPTHYVYSHLY